MTQLLRYYIRMGRAKKSNSALTPTERMVEVLADFMGVPSTWSPVVLTRFTPLTVPAWNGRRTLWHQHDVTRLTVLQTMTVKMRETMKRKCHHSRHRCRPHFSRQPNFYGHCATSSCSQVSYSSPLEFARQKNCLKLNNAVKQTALSRQPQMHVLRKSYT